MTSLREMPAPAHTYTSFDVLPAGSTDPAPVRVQRRAENYLPGEYLFGAGFGAGYGVGPYGTERPWWSASGTGQDRKHGRDLPIFWNETDLRGFRLVARDLASRNQFAIGFLNLLTAYHVHKGFGWQACLKGSRKTPYSTARNTDPTVEKAQRILDSWRDAVKWPKLSREAFKRWRRDGEVFGRFWRSESNHFPTFRFIDPELIASPTGDTDTDASFGKLNEPGDVGTTLAYHVLSADDPTRGVWTTADYNIDPRELDVRGEVERGCIIHVLANVDLNIKRGVTDFLPVSDQLDGCRRLLRGMMASTNEQAEIAWIEKFPGATLAQVRGIVPEIPSRPNAITDPAADPFRGYRGYGYYPPQRQGSRLRTEGDREFEPTPGGQGVPNYIQALQASLRGLCQMWGLPEFASGDASNNNFASALVANGPFVRVVEGTQYEWGADWERPVALKVLELAAEVGMLTPGELSKLDVEVTEPQVKSADPAADAQVNQTYHQMAVKSATTIQLELGLDPAHETENFAAEKQQGFQPGDEQLPDDDGQDDGGGGSGGGGGELGALAAKLKGGGSQESRFREVKDASGHEHDAKGKFGSGGSGAKGHTVKLPKNRRKVTIDQAATALHQMGYELSKSHFDLKTKTISFHLTHPDGSTSVASADEVKEIIYRGRVGESRRRTEDRGPAPFPGAVLDQTKHRWVNPNKNQSKNRQPAKKDGGSESTPKWATSDAGVHTDHHDDPDADYGQEKPNPSLPHETRPKLSAKEVRAVQEYTGEDGNWADVNAHLRSGGKLWITTLQDAINKAGALPEPVTTRRGLNFDSPGDMEEFVSTLEAAKSAGETVVDRGFVSTSTNAPFPGKVQLEIVAHHGLDASHYGYNTGELLLPAGTEFRVLSVERVDGRVTAKLEQVVAGGSKRESAGAGLVKRTITIHRDGKEFSQERMVSAKSAASAHPAASDPPSAEHLTAGLAEKIAAADPEAAKDKGLLGRIGDKVVALGARVYLFALKHEAVIRGGVGVLEAVFDTPADLKTKLGYDPSTTAGTSHAGSPDQIKAATGISGHIAILAASHAITAVVGYAKKKLGLSEGDVTIDQLAELIAGMLAMAAEEFDLAAPPDAASIAAHLRAL